MTVLLLSLSGEPLRSLTTRSVSLTRRSLLSHFAPSRSYSLLTDPVLRSFFLQHERTTCCSRVHLRRACVRPMLPCATRAARVLRTKASSFLSVLSGSLLLSITAIDASRSRLPSRHPALARGARSPPSLSRPDHSFSLAFLARSPARAARAPRKARTPPPSSFFLLLACSIPHLALSVSATSIAFSIFVFHPCSRRFTSFFSILPLHTLAPFLRLFPVSALLLLGCACARRDRLFLSTFLSFSFSFVRPIPPYPLIRATFSIQPRHHPLDYRLLFLRGHPVQLVLRVRRANNLFPSPFSTVTISLSLRFTF